MCVSLFASWLKYRVALTCFTCSAIVSLLPLAYAQFAYEYVFITPTGWISGAPANASWTAAQGNPQEFALLLKTFNTTTNEQLSWELVNPASTYAGFANFTVPDVVPGCVYLLLHSLIRTTDAQVRRRRPNYFLLPVSVQ